MQTIEFPNIESISYPNGDETAFVNVGSKVAHPMVIFGDNVESEVRKNIFDEMKNHGLGDNWDYNKD